MLALGCGEDDKPTRYCTAVVVSDCVCPPDTVCKSDVGLDAGGQDAALDGGGQAASHDGGGQDASHDGGAADAAREASAAEDSDAEVVTDAGNADARDGALPGVECSGGYDGATEVQLAQHVQSAKGACAAATDLAGVCSAEPSSHAREVTIPCYFSFSGDAMLSSSEVAAQTEDCALHGKGDVEGLVTTLAPMSEGCLSCYVRAVVCSAQECPAECGSGTEAECTSCRADKGCTSDFFACSGLPTRAQLGLKP